MKVLDLLFFNWQFKFQRGTISLILDGHTTSDIIYHWKKDDAKKFRGIGVSKELSSIRFTVDALNTREEEISLQPSK